MIEDFIINNVNQLTIGAFSVAFLMLTWRYFTNREIEREIYIKQLILENQTNTKQFTETINHSQSKMTIAIDKLTHSIEDQTEIFKELIRK